MSSYSNIRPGSKSESSTSGSAVGGRDFHNKILHEMKVWVCHHLLTVRWAHESVCGKLQRAGASRHHVGFKALDALYFYWFRFLMQNCKNAIKLCSILTGEAFVPVKQSQWQSVEETGKYQRKRFTCDGSNSCLQHHQTLHASYRHYLYFQD